MTVQQIFDKIRFIGRYTENDATDAQLLSLLNNAVKDQVKFVTALRQDFLLKSGTAIDLVSGTDDYTLATDIMQIKQIQLALDGTNYYTATRKDLNQASDLVNETEVMSAPKYITIGQSNSTEFKIRIQPSVTNSVTSGLKYWYIARPAELTLTTETPVTPEDLHPALAQKVLQDLKQRDGDSVGMRLANQEEKNLLDRYRSGVSQRNIDNWDGFVSIDEDE